jgi:Na+-driven multidrug efflux pump
VSGVINSAQRSIGNTRIALTSNLAANIVNVVFDYLLITGKCGFPVFGIVGDAIPAVMGSMVACGMSVWSVRRSGYLRLNFRECFYFRPELLKPLLKVGMGAGVEQICIRIGFFTYSATVANLGTAAFATHQICMNILNLSFTFGDGLGMASSALVGQNLGKKDRICPLVRKIRAACRLFRIAVLGFIVLLCGKNAVGCLSRKATKITATIE